MSAKANLDKEQILELARNWWKISEMAAFFKVSIPTLYEYCDAEEMQQAREEARGRLRAHYYKRAFESDKILMHAAECDLDMHPKSIMRLADYSDEALVAEGQRRVAAQKMLSNSTRQRTKRLEAKLEATGSGEPVVSSTEPSNDPDSA